VGAYQLLQELAHGGMGVVYMARHLALGRVVALKMMRGERCGLLGQQRFDREMRAVARLNHPNILPIYEIGWHDEQPYYTMPFLAGGSLAQQRDKRLSDSRSALQLMVKVARAVQYAHEQGIVHRDLKLGNVLLDERGEPFVTDFGLAKIQDDNVELTESGQVVGTPAYMAPEQAAGRTRQIGPWSDVWALGVMLCELLTGQRPFAGDTSAEVKESILDGSPKRLRELRPELNVAVEAIILKCLRKEPSRRYASAGALADDLERYLWGERPEALPPSAVVRLLRGLRRRWRSSAVAALSVILLLILAAIYFSPSPPPPLPPPIVLIDDGKMRAQPRWIVGEKAATHKDGTADEPFSLHSAELSMLELLSAPPWPRYRLEARLRREGESDLGQVGIFFALNHYPTLKGGYFSFWDLGLTEREPRTGKVELVVARVQDFPPHATGALSPLGLPPHFYPRADRGGNRAPWRTLAVERDFTEVRAFWGDELIGQLEQKSLNEFSAQILLGMDEVPFGQFSPEGGLGIYVQNGKASFQQVILQPLP
jgi:serine/threonine-protein kinase